MSWLKQSIFCVSSILCGSAAADTYVVDAGGSGDFTDLPQAIAATTAGDVLLVLPGLYSGFTLDRPLVIEGVGAGVRVGGPARIEGLVTGPAAVLAALELDYGLTVNACTAPVVLDSLSATRASLVTASADVRWTRCTLTVLLQPSSGVHALEVVDSRVEVTESTLRGRHGSDCFCCAGIPGDGGSALLAAGSSFVTVYRSSLTGGDGGDSGPVCYWIVAGIGGNGLLVHFLPTPAAALVAGSPPHVLAGGAGGLDYSDTGQGQELFPGYGLQNGGQTRLSGATVLSLDSGGLLELPAVADPTLHILAPPTAGVATTFRVTAQPGSSVDLLLGRQASIVPFGALEEDLLVVPQRVVHLGVVGPDGKLGYIFTVPSTLTTGFTFFAQARVVLPSSEQRYTNSVPLVLR